MTNIYHKYNIVVINYQFVYIVKVAVDSVGSGLLQTLRHIHLLVIEGAIETEFVNEPVDLIVSAGVSNDEAICV